MKNTLKNKSLKQEVKQLLKETTNIKSITKGEIGGYSIEIEYKEPTSVASFIYYEHEDIRDLDFTELLKILEI